MENLESKKESPMDSRFSNEAMKKAQEKMAQMRLNGWKPEILNPIDRSKKSPNSLKLAIRAMCWSCEGRDSDPHVKQRVADCAVGERCPLYPHRPWQHLKGSSIDHHQKSPNDAENEHDSDEDE